MLDSHQKPLVSLDEITRAEYLFAECTEHIDKTPQCHRDSAGGGVPSCHVFDSQAIQQIWHLPWRFEPDPLTIPTKLFVKGFLP